MWRISRQISIESAGKVSRCLKRERIPRRTVQSFPDPHETSGGGKGKLFLALTGTAFAAVGGTVAYAKYDDKFRTWVENSVPMSSSALDLILGPKEKPKPPQPTKQVQKSIEKKPAIQPRREEPSQQKPSVTRPTSPAVSSSPKAEVKPSSPGKKLDLIGGAAGTGLASATAVATERALTSEKTADDEKLQQRLASQEVDAAAENAALEQILKENLQVLEKASQAAVIAQQEALQSIKAYTGEVERALEAKDTADKDNLRFRLNSANSTKTETLLKAEAKMKLAKELMEKVRSAIKEGRHSKITTANPVLISSEETVNRLSYQILSSEAQTSSAKSEAKIMTEYRETLEKSRKQFNDEMQTILPQLASVDREKHLTAEELRSLIRKSREHIKHLQDQVTLQEASERLRFQKSMENQRREHDQNVKTLLELEASKHQQEQDVRFQQKISEMRDEFEHELRVQLRRQAAAHSDHLQEVLQGQQQELETQYKQIMEDKVGAARQEFEANLARSYARLRGIEEGLKARAELNWSARTSQALWLACQSLHHALKVGQPNKKSWEEQLRPMKPEIEVVLAALQASDGKSSDYVVAVLQAVPERAIVRGIYPESALKERFVTVYRTCQRVALVGDEGGSLLRFALSYIQSVIMIDGASRLTIAELATKPIDPNALSPYDVLTRARWCVERDDLEQALRFMNLLRGAPRRVASDWMAEVRLLLETRQAADALVALSAATGVQAYI